VARDEVINEAPKKPEESREKKNLVDFKQEKNLSQPGREARNVQAPTSATPRAGASLMSVQLRKELPHMPSPNFAADHPSPINLLPATNRPSNEASQKMGKSA
jgi:hypothetical protein